MAALIHGGGDPTLADIIREREADDEALAPLPDLESVPGTPDAYEEEKKKKTPGAAYEWHRDVHGLSAETTADKLQRVFYSIEGILRYVITMVESVIHLDPGDDNVTDMSKWWNKAYDLRLIYTALKVYHRFATVETDVTVRPPAVDDYPFPSLDSVVAQLGVIESMFKQRPSLGLDTGSIAAPLSVLLLNPMPLLEPAHGDTIKTATREMINHVVTHTRGQVHPSAYDAVIEPYLVHSSMGGTTRSSEVDPYWKGVKYNPHIARILSLLVVWYATAGKRGAAMAVSNTLANGLYGWTMDTKGNTIYDPYYDGMVYRQLRGTWAHTTERPHVIVPSPRTLCTTIMTGTDDYWRLALSEGGDERPVGMLPALYAEVMTILYQNGSEVHRSGMELYPACDLLPRLMTLSKVIARWGGWSKWDHIRSMLGVAIARLRGFAIPYAQPPPPPPPSVLYSGPPMSDAELVRIATRPIESIEILLDNVNLVCCAFAHFRDDTSATGGRYYLVRSVIRDLALLYDDTRDRFPDDEGPSFPLLDDPVALLAIHSICPLMLHLGIAQEAYPMKLHPSVVNMVRFMPFAKAARQKRPRCRIPGRVCMIIHDDGDSTALIPDVGIPATMEWLDGAFTIIGPRVHDDEDGVDNLLVPRDSIIEWANCLESFRHSLQPQPPFNLGVLGANDFDTKVKPVDDKAPRYVFPIAPLAPITEIWSEFDNGDTAVPNHITIKNLKVLWDRFTSGFKKLISEPAALTLAEFSGGDVIPAGGELDEHFAWAGHVDRENVLISALAWRVNDEWKRKMPIPGNYGIAITAASIALVMSTESSGAEWRIQQLLSIPEPQQPRIVMGTLPRATPIVHPESLEWACQLIDLNLFMRGRYGMAVRSLDIIRKFTVYFAVSRLEIGFRTITKAFPPKRIKLKPVKAVAGPIDPEILAHEGFKLWVKSGAQPPGGIPLVPEGKDVIVWLSAWRADLNKRAKRTTAFPGGVVPPSENNPYSIAAKGITKRLDTERKKKRSEGKEEKKTKKSGPVSQIVKELNVWYESIPEMGVEPSVIPMVEIDSDDVAEIESAISEMLKIKNRVFVKRAPEDRKPQLMEMIKVALEGARVVLKAAETAAAKKRKKEKRERRRAKRKEKEKRPPPSDEPDDPSATKKPKLGTSGRFAAHELYETTIALSRLCVAITVCGRSNFNKSTLAMVGEYCEMVAYLEARTIHDDETKGKITGTQAAALVMSIGCLLPFLSDQSGVVSLCMRLFKDISPSGSRKEADNYRDVPGGCLSMLSGLYTLAQRVGMATLPEDKVKAPRKKKKKTKVPEAEAEVEGKEEKVVAAPAAPAEEEEEEEDEEEEEHEKEYTPGDDEGVEDATDSDGGSGSDSDTSEEEKSSPTRAKRKK